MTIATVAADYRVRIATAGAAVVAGNVAVTLTLEDFQVPTLAGPSIDLLSYNTTSHPFTVDCLVDAVLFSASQRMTALGRLIEIQRDIGSGWTTVATGRISRVSESDRGLVRLDVSDERWKERLAPIFTTTDSVQLHPPGLSAAWMDYPAAGTRTYIVAEIDGDAVRFQPDDEGDAPDILTVPLALREALGADMVPGQVASPSNSDGNFVALRFEYDSVDRRVLSFTPNVTGWSTGTTGIAGGLGTMSPSPAASGLLVNVWVYIAGHSLSVSDEVTARLYWPGGIATTETIPLLIGGVSGIDPMELLEDLLDGDWGGGAVNYDATAMQAVQDLDFEDVWIRASGPADRAQWIENDLYRTFGVLPLVGTDLVVRPTALELPSGFSTAGLTRLDASNSSNATWDHSTRYLVNVASYRASVVREAPTDTEDEDLPADGLELIPTLSLNAQHDNTAALGESDYSVETSLIFGDEATQYSDLIVPVGRLTDELFDVFGDGAQTGEVTVPHDAGVEVGDRVILDCGSLALWNVNTGARSGDLLALLISFRDMTPASTTFGYLALGPLSQAEL